MRICNIEDVFKYLLLLGLSVVNVQYTNNCVLLSKPESDYHQQRPEHFQKHITMHTTTIS